MSTFADRSHPDRDERAAMRPGFDADGAHAAEMGADTPRTGDGDTAPEPAWVAELLDRIRAELARRGAK